MDGIVQKRSAVWPIIISQSKKIIHLLDLCGSEKYLKTTASALCGLYPHYCIVVIDVNKGFEAMAKEHIAILIALKIPLFVILTKYDS